MKSQSVCAPQPLRMLFSLFRLELTPEAEDVGVKDTVTARPKVDVCRFASKFCHAKAVRRRADFSMEKSSVLF